MVTADSVPVVTVGTRLRCVVVTTDVALLPPSSSSSSLSLWPLGMRTSSASTVHYNCKMDWILLSFGIEIDTYFHIKKYYPCPAGIKYINESSSSFIFIRKNMYNHLMIPRTKNITQSGISSRICEMCKLSFIFAKLISIYLSHYCQDIFKF